MGSFKQYLLWMIIISPLSSVAFSASYFYELYIHNEYYAEPPGFPSKFVLSPIISTFHGSRPGLWHEDRLATGVVGAVRLTRGHSWIEFITAMGKERVKLDQQGVISKGSRFGMDDFLIDIGHNFLDKSGKKQVLIHWLTGIPINGNITAIQVNQPLWGTRTYATGPVIEGIFEFMRNDEYDIFLGLISRYLRRFKRRYEPILPANAFFKPGTQLDILALFHYRRYEHNVEFGYVFTRFYNSSYRFADSVQRLSNEKYNSIYGDYFYYDEKHNRGYELNITKTFGKPYHGITIFGAAHWYF